MKVDFRDVLVFGGVALMSGGAYLMLGTSAALVAAGLSFYILGVAAKL